MTSGIRIRISARSARRLLAVALSASVVAACGGSESGGARGGTLTLAPLVQPRPWDLKDAGLGNNAQYYQPVYDSLFRLDERGNPTGNVATEWSYNRENTVLTIDLRDDAGTFTDGGPVDAAAVKANLDHTRTGTNEAAGMLKSITRTEVLDSNSVRVTLSAPDPSLVANLGNVAGMLASPKAIKSGALADGPVGSGPYTLDQAKTTPGTVYTFVRNPDYWNEDAFPFDSIVLKPMSDPGAVLDALRAGDVNGALLTTPSSIAPAKEAGLNVTEILTGDVDGVYIWDRAGTLVPALGNVKVRQAINMAFDKAAIVKSAKEGLGQPTTQLFNKATLAYDARLDGRYRHDLTRARQLMAEAGYAHGFVVTVPDLSPAFPEAQAAMNEGLEALGIRVELDEAPIDEIIDDLLAGKYAMSYFSLASFRPWDTVTIQMLKDSLWNPLGYEDPTAKALIDRVQRAEGVEAANLFRQLNAYVVGQAWDAPWTQVENGYATSEDVVVEPFSFAPVPPIYDIKPGTA